MKLLRLIPNNINFDFLRIKVIAFLLTLCSGFSVEVTSSSSFFMRATQ